MNSVSMNISERSPAVYKVGLRLIIDDIPFNDDNIGIIIIKIVSIVAVPAYQSRQSSGSSMSGGRGLPYFPSLYCGTLLAFGCTGGMPGCMGGTGCMGCIGCIPGCVGCVPGCIDGCVGCALGCIGCAGGICCADGAVCACCSFAPAGDSVRAPASVGADGVTGGATDSPEGGGSAQRENRVRNAGSISRRPRAAVRRRGRVRRNALSCRRSGRSCLGTRCRNYCISYLYPPL